MTTDTLSPSETPLLLDAQTADLLFREARTVNTFSPDEITDEQLAAVYDLVRWGPTAMNISPLRVLVVRTPEGRERLAAHMADGNRAKTERAPLSLVVATDVDFHEHMGRLAPHMGAVAEGLAGAPEARAAMARDNAFLQVGYLIVGLRAAGLHAGPMGGFDAAALDADLLAGTSWRSVLVINVGQAPAEHDDLQTPSTYPRQTRLDFAEVARTV
ncbi:malonic semialdehyde reductase [Cellulomonas cellasea]|uniref:Malonic semialdehyde reductase n=2 Tax=Cellulomonas cellasea TaxID=43670 RepID=A0A0A0BBZ8_9CELL|nr:malonic semialdehyde reductase [Cellulomonas cellasea]KGM02856.1 malonic semialdehyde reductase [Cellulomonas cellasea DSM 20118]GEA87182.1 nitroreductase family protein [Cellulomonas cellasea]